MHALFPGLKPQFRDWAEPPPPKQQGAPAPAPEQEEDPTQTALDELFRVSGGAQNGWNAGVLRELRTTQKTWRGTDEEWEKLETKLLIQGLMAAWEPEPQPAGGRREQVSAGGRRVTGGFGLQLLRNP